MSEKRFTVESTMVRECILDNKTGEQLDTFDYTERLCEFLNEQQATINDLEKQRDYWKNKAMTLLMQVRRLTSRMTDKEVKEFSKELEDD